MVSSNSPEDHDENLSVDKRREIDNWSSKRRQLIQDRTRNEIDLSLEDDAALFRKSTSFLKLYVKAYHKDIIPRKKCNKDTNCAILTIWRVSDSQREILRERGVSFE